MSLVTQCPQCALLFQVPAAQLAATKGQVCCRQCAHVFEGQAFAITAPGPASVFNIGAAVDLPADLSTESLLSSPRIDLDALLRRKDMPSVPVPVAISTPTSAVSVSSMTAPAPLPVPPVAPIQQPEATLVSVRAPQLPVKPDLRIESAAVGAARRTAWALRSSALLLAVGLCMQSLVFFRDEIAARWPGGRPMLDVMCPSAACMVAPLRRWNGVVIDSSSLVRGDVGYVLNLSLRNSVDISLAMTSMELTLTDDQDRALMRRVLSPADLGAPGLLAAGQTWQRALLVEPLATVPEIAGYRLVSFYP